MAQPIANLIVNIAADTSELKTHAEAAKQTLDEVKTSVDRMGSGVEAAGAQVTKLAEGFLAWKTLSEGLHLADQIIKDTSALEDQSRATGIATDQLQKLLYVGQAFGIQGDIMVRAVEQFSAKLAGGDNNAARAVQELGLNVDALIQMGPDRAFVAFTQAADGVANPMDRAAYFTEVFGGRVGKTLMSMGDLSQAMRDVPQGAIISEDAIKSAHDFDVEVEHATTHLKAFAAEAIHAAGGGISDVLKGILTGGDVGSTLLLGAFSTTALSGFKDVLHSVGIEVSDVGERSRTAADGIASTGVAAEGATQRQQAYANEVKALETAHVSLTSEVKRQIETLHDLDDSTANIAKTLHLNEGAVAGYVKQLDEQKRAQVELDAAVKEVDLSGTSWRTTVAGLNQEMVTQVKNSLDAGVSVKSLALYWSEEESVIRDVKKAMEEENAVAQKASREQAAELQELKTLWAEYDDLRVQHGGTATDQQIAQINKWASELTARMQKAGLDTAQFYDALGTVVNEKMRDVLVDWDAITHEMSTNTQEGLQQIATKAQATFQEALTHSGQFSNETLQHFRDIADQAQIAADTFGMSFATNAGVVAKAATDSAKTLDTTYGGALRNLKGQAAATFDEIAAGLRRADDAYKNAGFLLHSDLGTLLLREQQTGGKLVGYGTGTDFAPGGPAIVGERGPEIVDLPRGARVTPNGGWGGGSLSVTVQVIAPPGSSAAEQGRLAGDATVARLQALGVRL